MYQVAALTVVADVAVEVPRTSWSRCDVALYLKTRSVPEST